MNYTEQALKELIDIFGMDVQEGTLKLDELEDFLRKKLEGAREDGRKDALVKVLEHYHSNSLKGKGFDFYFVLRNMLDALQKESK